MGKREILEQLSNDEDMHTAAVTRLGHHNDCFLASETDIGTFQDDTDRQYLADDTVSLAMGGETCGVFPPRTNCTTSLEELARYHWSYLNRMYHHDVLDGWQTEG